MLKATQVLGAEVLIINLVRFAFKNYRSRVLQTIKQYQSNYCKEIAFGRDTSLLLN